MTNRKTRNQVIPRREAVPLRWPSEGEDSFDDPRPVLTEPQIGAAKQLWRAFEDYYLERAPTRSYAHPDRCQREGLHAVVPAIDDRRRNQVLLLDGGRGTGKTALLITLIDTWNRALRGDPALQSKGRDASLAQLCDLDGRVVPVALLDLRALPRKTSLLVHMSGQLKALVNEFGIATTPTAPAISPLRTKDDAARRAWRDFLTATASTEHYMRKRSAELDPESFAAELHDTEQDRSQLNARFRDLVDHLVEAFEARRKRERGVAQAPVFVIAIDDADMSPERTAECFELLNGFVHPRLVFVLTGETDLFMHSLRAQFLGELRSPLHRVEVDADERKQLGDFDKAFALAQRYYDKLIPVTHRCIFRELPPHERIVRLRDELAGIEAGGASVLTVFERAPELGALLPGQLRELDDFRPQLRECAKERGALDFLLLVQRRLLLQPALHEHRELIEKLLSRPTGVIHEGVPPYRVRTQVLDFYHQIEAPRVHKGSHRAELLEGHILASLHVYPASLTPPPFEDEDSEDIFAWYERAFLADPLPHFALLLEYLRPVLGSNLVHFEHRGGVFLTFHPLSTPLFVRGLGTYSSSWPRAVFPLEYWQSHDLSRMWSAALLRIWDETRPLDEDLLELLALNYLNIVAHVVDSRLESERPAIISDLPSERRQQQWIGILERLVAHRDQLVNWLGVDLLEFAHPESRLSPGAAARLLTALEATYQPEERLQVQLDQSEEIRRGKLREALKNNERASISWRELHERINERFSDHPWVERYPTPSIEETFADIFAILDKVEIGAKIRPAWIPQTATGYLVGRTRELFERLDPTMVKRIDWLLSEQLKQGSGAQLALYGVWEGIGPNTDHRGGLYFLWTDFNARAFIETSQVPKAPLRADPSTSGIAELSFLLYHPGQTIEPELPDDALAVYRLLFDVAHDDVHAPMRGSNEIWPLVRVRHAARDKIATPWPEVGWNTYFDHHVTAQQWAASIAPFERTPPTPQALGQLARTYIEAQVHTFIDRSPKTRSLTEQSWTALFEWARASYEHTPGKYARTRAFRIWLYRCLDFATPSAALTLVEAAAAQVAYLEVLAPMFSNFFTPPDPLLPGKWADEHDHPARWIRTWVDHDKRRMIIDRLRADYEARAPELFASPEQRRQAVERLVTSLPSELRTYLSPDLRARLEQTYTHALMVLATSLAAEHDLQAKMLAAWTQTSGRARALIQHDGKRWRVEGRHFIDHDDTETWPLAAELQVDYTLHAGRMASDINEDLGYVIHALIHDYVLEHQASDTLLDPIRWPLAEVNLGSRRYEPWPCVQWPTRIDRQFQLRSWQHDFERRKKSDAESLGGRMRHFIASTADIFSTRTLYEQYRGGWKEVIRSAREAVKHGGDEPDSQRDQCYAAWVAQLPRFALPRAGLTERDAADVLVRCHEYGERQFHAQLTGRLDRAGGAVLPFGDATQDHPAARVAACETDEALDACIADLRKQYELG